MPEEEAEAEEKEEEEEEAEEEEKEDAEGGGGGGADADLHDAGRTPRAPRAPTRERRPARRWKDAADAMPPTRPRAAQATVLLLALLAAAACAYYVSAGGGAGGGVRVPVPWPSAPAPAPAQLTAADAPTAAAWGARPTSAGGVRAAHHDAPPTATQPPPPQRQRHRQQQQHRQRQQQQRDDGDDSVILTLILMGNRTCTTYDAEAAVWSAVHYGRWNGTVQVLTDAPECIRLDQLAAVLGGRAPDVRLVRVPAAHNLSQVKRWKTRQHESAPEFRFSLYIDTDIRVHQPLAPFVEHAKARVRAPDVHSGIAAFCRPYGSSRFTGNRQHGLSGQRSRCHTGVLFSARGTSDACMAAWRAKLTDDRDKDQPAFEQVTRVARSDRCRVAALDARRWLLFPSVATQRGFAWQLGHSNATFYHVTNTNRRRQMEQHGWTDTYHRILQLPPALAQPKTPAPR